jgi:hypothetical protein
MVRQEWILRLPQFTITNVRVEMDKTKKSADEIATRGQQKIKGLAAQFQAESEKVALTEMNEVVDCKRREVLRKRDETLLEIDKNISVLQASVKAAADANAVELEKQMRENIASLTKARGDVAKQFNDALAQLDLVASRTFSQQSEVAATNLPSGHVPVAFKSLQF